eukprot:CAMPEP_0168440980 /NCGR_PEP_ID=MMETSP0228-20121227/43251_1 /TAXON_ID=133427 /ORGANISM="Protoceratium reticulatum, Strain CCCM 535 (=CCMP 1889)" /LENGTH=740 /DNA_ID=CAMNT_0008455285 /DNA_START=26 /DNA_END=2245 /DNA_ORIENTATION=-
MAPRRGGAGGAGAETAAVGAGRNYFEPPPLARRHPWQQDGSANCDVIAGGVDETGVFKGIYVSGVHLMALMRTFQLSRVFMPCDVPTPVAALGQSLQDGVPIIIVTRNCFGRELDYGPGPARNDVQKTIWQSARDMRAEMPQVLITTIDVPINLNSDMLQACLEPPLNEYRELMYHQGTWYTPQVQNAQHLAKWANENQRPISKEVASKTGRSGFTLFNRKKFDWQDASIQFQNVWVLGWRAVLEVQGPPEVPRRTDLRFTPDAPKPGAKPVAWGPSVAEVALDRALAKAREEGDAAALPRAAAAFAEKAEPRETEALQKALGACDEASERFTAESKPTEAFEAVQRKVKILIGSNRLDEALAAATAAREAAAEPTIEASALQLVVDCLQGLGDLDKAVETATAGRADIARKGNDDALCTAWRTVVSTHEAKGDTEGAISAATEATQGKGRCEATGYILLATAQMAKANESELSPQDFRAAAKEAAANEKKAAGLFAALQAPTEQADALRAAVANLLLSEEYEEALSTATEVRDLGKASDMATIEGLGWEMMAAVHVRTFTNTRAYLQGGASEMETAARTALGYQEAVGTGTDKARSMMHVADAIFSYDPVSDEAQKLAKKAAAAFKAAGGGANMVDALLSSARASLRRGHLSSAYWDAKQALVECGLIGDSLNYDAATSILGQVIRISEETGKPMNVGAPVPLASAAASPSSEGLAGGGRPGYERPRATGHHLREVRVP